MVNTTQAIVAVGGKARRLRDAGVEVRISKSFIKMRGEPLLYWNLMALHYAGIRRLVICGDDMIYVYEAELVLDRLGLAFDDVQILRDPGLGVHGLPYQICGAPEYHLDDTFIFECGHSLMTPEHYRALDATKKEDRVVFSAFVPHPSNARQPVSLEDSKIALVEGAGPGYHALAHPLLIDHAYVAMLPRLGFDISRIIAHYAARDQLDYVFSEMPPEFDVPDEFRAAQEKYDTYLQGGQFAGSDT